MFGNLPWNLLMYTEQSQPFVHRAIVSSSNPATGEIKVRIPSKFGPELTLDVSFIGRKKLGGFWSVPAIGDQVVVTTDNSDYTNVFILNVNPTVNVDNDQSVIVGQVY